VLTTKDVQPHPQETDTHFFFVVNMPQALAAQGNAAETLYAQYLESEITKYAQIKELASNPEMIEAVLSVERVATPTSKAALLIRATRSRFVVPRPQEHLSLEALLVLCGRQLLA
jgi:hypothetical protein